nr:MAG TPA: hypothetical protein [Caudoviricetes sp.]
MKKIMFNDKYGLTQAVLEGRKTQTRRIIPKDFFSLTWDKRDDTLVYENSMGDFIDIRNSKYALCKAGEIVAVAQSYRDCGGVNEEGIPMWEIISSKVGGTNAGWSNKMFVRAELMPHYVIITAVSVERLRDISDVDCMAEGIDYYEQEGFSWCSTEKLFDTPREAYAALIDKVSGKGTWDSNPYVFVYDFELVKKWK